MSTLAASNPGPLSALAPRRRLDPAGSELTTLGLTLAFGVLALAYGGALLDLANVVLPLVLLVTSALGAARMLRLDAANLWTPLLWMRIAVGLYFGFGALVPIFASAAALTYIQALFAFVPAEMLKLNVVILSYILIVLGCCYAFDRLAYRRLESGKAARFQPAPSIMSLPAIGLLFLAVGSFVTFFILLPNRFGLTQFVPPNTVNEIGMLSYVGLFFLSSWAFRRGGLIIVPVVLAGVIYFVLGLLSFSKTDALFPVILVGIGFVYNRPNVLRIATLVVLVVGTYFFSNQIVQDGRELLYQRYDSLAGAPIGERLEIIQTTRRRNELAERGTINFGVTRLSYTNTGTYVIADYDAGLKGDSTRNALVTLVPRFLWPDKPIVTDVARELSFAATGIYDNSVSPTLPADAYWNNGWVGVFGWAFLGGAIMWAWSCYTVAVLRAQAWHLFAVVLIGARTGARVDGFLVVDLLGPISLAIVAHFLLTGLNSILRRNG